MPRKKDMPRSTTGHHVRSEERPLMVPAKRQIRPAKSRIRELRGSVPNSWSKADEFAIQLLLDPAVEALEFRTSLPFSDTEVPIGMFIADLEDGRVAFDLVDARPPRDLDEEGLLLLALEHHGICLVEIDQAAIDKEPRASNCRRIWSYREHRVPAPIRVAIDRALAVRKRLTIRSLASIIGRRDPMRTVGALVSQGVLAVDPSTPLGLNSVIGRRSDHWPSSGRLNCSERASQ
ncbi:hypothetical protein ABIF90_000927 [Bradyrhizobium japonicum]